ncbi:putative phospholipase domain-containing hypothetical protein [Candidatus Regiella insecticola LSR1]|uniref:Phosphatidylinositol diacylglycerol-lyase n=1 Tax=Candidatus Regiella insecticola LSR1 TaxID=663321 RepID=E0WR46_9ENTR|nr:hypothetical protein [Candidatus Regiella insecticola]EFL92606.1 putative phospholipase domain-containing hypothetical protein [Candidatus Regiella insecticola LSR1]
MTGFNLVNDSSRKSILTQNILNQPEGNFSKPGFVNHLTHCDNTPETMLSGKELKANRIEAITNAQMCGTTPINNIAMLGTHDSGTYAMENLTGISRCQKINLIQQAEQGAQYFDLRVRRNDEGVWKFYHGERGAAFGGFNSSNEAIPEVKALFQYAAAHSENMFIFKFHFDTEGRFAPDNETTVKNFIDEVSSDYRARLIKKTNENDRLGDLTLDQTLKEKNNIAILANHAGTVPQNNEEIWDYKATTRGGWGKMPRAEQLVKHLEKSLKSDKEEILVSQTNLPAFLPPSAAIFSNPKALMGLEALAKSLHAKVATAFSKLVKENNFNPGIISMDFIGIDHLSSTALYRELCNFHNRQFVPKISELLMAS